MLTRRREQIILLAGLLVLNAILGGYLYRLWRGYRSRTQWIYSGTVPGPAASASPAPAAPPPQSFAEIVNRNLFTPERASQSPDQQVKRPDLPLFYGAMNLGDGWFALMALADQPSAVSKRVLPGEEIGSYKLVSIAGSQVVVEWGEKTFTLDVWESSRRVPRVVERMERTPTARTAAPPPTSTGPGRVTTVAPAAAPSSVFEAERRKFSPAGYNAPPGATVDAPAGTVVGGKRKVVNRTPFGDQVFWVDAQPSASATGKENEKKEK